MFDDIPELGDEVTVGKFGKGTVSFYSEEDMYGGVAEMVVDFEDGIPRRISIDHYWTGDVIDDGQDGEEYVEDELLHEEDC